jgi:SagB-type dehydrogenase family enzyme
MIKQNKNYIDSAVLNLDVPIDEKGIKEMPLAWTKVFYKKYPRFKKFSLDIDFKEESFLNSLNLKRESNRDLTNEKISFRELSNLLFWSFGEKPELKNSSFPRRMYPSGGGRYPLEAYIVVMNVEGMKKGIYHYNTQENILELVTKKTKEFKESLYGKFKKASFFVILANCASRNEIKYGTKALMLSLMDAGHMGQNFLLKCTEKGLGSCAVFGFDRNKISEILDLDEEEEVPFYCLVAGKIDTTKGVESTKID